MKLPLSTGYESKLLKGCINSFFRVLTLGGRDLMELWTIHSYTQRQGGQFFKHAISLTPDNYVLWLTNFVYKSFQGLTSTLLK